MLMLKDSHGLSASSAITSFFSANSKPGQSGNVILSLGIGIVDCIERSEQVSTIKYVATQIHFLDLLLLLGRILLFDNADKAARGISHDSPKSRGVVPVPSSQDTCRLTRIKFRRRVR